MNNHNRSNHIISSSASMYSFVGWIASMAVYICYVAWAVLPEETLHFLGITYYPSRYYATAIPAYFLVVNLLIGIGYIGRNMMSTADPEDTATMTIPSTISTTNQHNQFTTGHAPLTFIKCGVKEGIPEIGDIDPLQISSVLSFKGRQ